MLSAFTARRIVELKQRDKSKIESILAYGDRLLVGLNTGSLRIYRVNEILPDAQDHTEPSIQADSLSKNESHNGDECTTSSKKIKVAELLRENENFSKAKIEQLAIIKEANVLLSLSGGLVSIHDLQTFGLQEQLAKTKGAATFAVNSYIVKDASSGVPSIVSRLAVAVKRRLLMWAWRDMEIETAGEDEIALASSVKSLTWASGSRIVAGLSGGYVMVDLDSKETTPVVGPGSIGDPNTQDSGTRLGGVGLGAMSYVGMGITTPKPFATALGEGEMLLAKDVNTHFINRKGEAIGRRQIPWPVAPEAIGYSYPYLLSLQDATKGVLEVRNPETLTLLQSINLPGANILQVAQPNISLAHAGKGFLVASERVIWRMEELDYDSQIDALVERGHLDEAISLLGMLEDTLVRDKPERLREIKMQKAQKFFDEKRFRESLDLFTEVSAPAERVIRLYPKLIAGDLAEREPEAPDNETEALFVSPSKEGSIKGHQRSESTVESTDKPQASSRGLKSVKGHKKTLSVASSTIGSKAGAKKLESDAQSDASSVRTATRGSVLDRELPAKDLKIAVRELQSFLADIRRRLQRFFDQDQRVRDLSEVQASSNGENLVQMLQFLFGVSSLHGIDVEQKVIDIAKLVDTTLFRAYMYATPSMAGSLFRITNFCDPDVVMEKLEETGRHNDLIDFLYGKRLHRSALERLRKFGRSEDLAGADEQVHGPARTVRYLQNLPPELIDLILEFAQWPIQADPELGMEVFLADTENAESLPHDRVFEFLETVDKSLALRYLEHVVDELNDLNPDLHHKLATLYLELLKASSGNLIDAVTADLHTKLVTHLKQSTQYSPAKLLSALPRDDERFYEPRAVVFAKMGQHRQALDIYVFKLHDTAKAEEYCNQVHRDEAKEALTSNSGKSVGDLRKKSMVIDPINDEKSVYTTLLNLYLNPPTGEKAMWGPAIELLAHHGARLPAAETLALVPDSLLVKELEFYFRGRMRGANSVVNDSRVEVGLRKVEAVRVQAGLLLGEGASGANGGRTRNVSIDEERICGVCHKRLGQSVISVFPEYVGPFMAEEIANVVVVTRLYIWDVLLENLWPMQRPKQDNARAWHSFASSSVKEFSWEENLSGFIE